MLPPQTGRRATVKHPSRASPARSNHTSGTKDLRTADTKTIRSSGRVQTSSKQSRKPRIPGTVPQSREDVASRTPKAGANERRLDVPGHRLSPKTDTRHPATRKTTSLRAARQSGEGADTERRKDRRQTDGPEKLNQPIREKVARAKKPAWR
ncbi:hypothetical protein VNI00_010549 [Paramarasmius palmivorus]|uniref:Uncharacterized protein n=1 Tax=Paramarasmius palmivorus TaxID=297713 RepID=A0AAW0CL60_9AGAR